ncbi:MAG: universal stress protein [Novosphingobium sp.]|uniref:universal stress protein n=1 Tax=Novosphingobium sp. TaxID=1874826 RepID=UPI0032B8C1F9
MRSILVQTGRDPLNAIRLDTAMNVARARGGHVTLLIDTPVDRYITADPYGGTFIAREALDAAVADDDALAELFEGRLANDDVPFDVIKFETNPLEAMISGSRLSDLIVVSRTCGYAGDLAVEGNAPVLVLGNVPLAMPLASACIAWDGGTEAALALRSAVPLLADCARVAVLTVSDEAASGFPPTDALRYLARHGIKAELTVLTKTDSVEETLAAEARQQGAQLLVMGAYSHSRVREFLFGGVTRYFIEDADGPALLLAH